MSTPAEDVPFKLLHHQSRFGEEGRVMVKRGETWALCGILSLRANEWAAFTAATGFATFRLAPAPAPVAVPKFIDPASTSSPIKAAADDVKQGNTE